MQYADYALVFKALGDSTRAQIVDMLKSGKKCACKLLEAFNITQPTLSYHMKMLVDCGLVLSEKRGKWNYYTLDSGILQSLSNFLNEKVEDDNSDVCDC